jgi:hypothetical protein
MYRCLLACGCKYTLKLETLMFPATWACDLHTRAAAFKIMAVECREYKLGCMDCRYGKWCGAAWSDYIVARNRHLSAHSGHRVFSTYCVHPNTKERFQKVYGRKVKLYIPDIIVPRPEDTAMPVLENLELPDDPPY